MHTTENSDEHTTGWWRRLGHYLRYLSFFSLYFNPLLAVCLLYDEIRGERKYGLHTTGIRKIHDLPLASVNAAHAHHYMPSNYVLLEDVFSFLNQYPHNKTLLDFGCGKGRALFVAARFGFRHLLGVELVEAYCNYIRKEAERTYSHARFEIFCTDAAHLSIPDFVQTIFLYNPFNGQVLQPVVQNIVQSLQQAPRQFYVIYLTPVYRQHLLDAGFKEIYRTSRFHYLQAAVYSNS